MYTQANRPLHARISVSEEVVNFATHGVGAILSASGLGVMAVLAKIHGDAWHVASAAVFGVTLIILYTISTLYHNSHQPKVKALLRQLDRSAIFLLIAGTYTPFTLISLRGPLGWPLFVVVWAMAVIGIVMEFLTSPKWPALSIILYFFMGWIVVVAINPLSSALSFEGLFLLLAGGVFYTFGILFYAWKKLPYHHAIWHLFVLAGSIMHYFAVLFYVIPS